MRAPALALAVLLGLTNCGYARAASRQNTAITPDGFTVARAPYHYRFPDDHFAHPGYQTEWWYYTGHLRAEDGRTFGFELTFFRAGMHPGDPPPRAGQSDWRGNELYPAHFAITDERAGTFFHTERFAREALGMGGASAHALDVHAGGWSLTGTASPHAPDRETMHLRANASDGTGAYALDAIAVPQKSPAIHGHGGISKKAACASCASHYYSYTRLLTTATLIVRGERLRTNGIAWMDHEFGSGELQSDQAGWDWFSLQLADGREVMLYRLREKNGTVTPESSGSLIERDGRVRYLPLSDFTISSSSTWTSPHTNGTYPAHWRVRIPSANIDLDITPAVADQELADTSSGVSYWEGSVRLRSSGSPEGDAGSGYVELTGYAGAISI